MVVPLALRQQRKVAFLFDKDQGLPPSTPNEVPQDAFPEESPPTLTVELEQVPATDDAESRLHKAIDLILRAVKASKEDRPNQTEDEQGEV